MFTILNIFTPLFSWCTSLGNRLKTQDVFHDYYQNYFQETSVCGNVFLVAVIISVALACVYYLICCNVSYSMAKRHIWAIILCLCFGLTLFITPYFILGNYDSAGLYSGDNNTLLFESAKRTLETNLSYIEDDQAREEIICIADQYVQQFLPAGDQTHAFGMFTMSESIPLQMSFINSIYGIILFFIFSVLLKRFTIHGKAIPF